jgi:hypothetical protein
MKAATGWVICRILRWALWLASIAYYCYVWSDLQSHLNQFNNLLPTTEALLFGLPMAAVFMGLLELMMRERAALPRPTFSRV